MHHHTTTAGYFNFALKARLEARYPNSEVSALLRQLSACHITSDFDLTPAKGLLPPEIVVLHNLVQRGMPTMPSLAVERALTALGYTKEDDKETLLDFPVTEAVNDAMLEEVFTALHVVDNNRFEPNYQDIFESGFESAVFLEETNRHPYLRQLLTPQVELPSLLPGETGFHRQRTDFVLPLLYPLAEKDPLKPSLKGFIVEVDGRPYHSSFRQQALDLRRDTATRADGWHTKRIQEKGAAVLAFDDITSPEFVKRVARHYHHPINSAWIDILQLALTPFAIARVQKVILDAILSGLLNTDEKQWEIVVVERDVPCAQLAIDDLNTWIEQLYALSGKTGVPRIVLKKVFVSREFEQVRLRGEENRIVGEYDGISCDLIVDVSVLRRYGMELNLRYPYPYAIVRSERWPWVNRQFHTARPIAYGQLASYEGERWSAIREREEQLEFFLQNLFRKKQFRQGQIPILHRALNLKTVIGLLPTGGGKSLTYQLAALLQPGITLVIDPLRSLMKDQVDNLVKAGVDACALMNSTQTKAQKDFALHQLMNCETIIFFVSPERLMMEAFREPLQQMRAYTGFAYCVIDEVHCVSEWGHDFRTAYLALGRNAVEHAPYIGEDKKIPLFGLTATASYDVLADVERELLLHDEPEAIVSAEYTGRDEIFFEVKDVPVEFTTYDLNVEHPGGTTLFTVKPIIEPRGLSLKKQVAVAKQAKINAILADIPSVYGNINNETVVRPVLEATYETLLEQSYRKEHPQGPWLNDKWKKLQYSGYNPEAFFEKNGGLIFVPHRKGVFGVTDKYILQRDGAGRTLRDAAGKPVFIAPQDRNAVADQINCHGMSGAVPLVCKDDHARSYIGTFVGSSDESQMISKITDEDSFRNQAWFIQNKLKVMVSTKAFGMGIDKSNIRFTVHFNSPSSPESFVQEAGRAGRDGKLAISYVLLNKQKLYAFRKRHFRILSKEGFTFPHKGTIQNRYFQEEDFRLLLQHMKLPALEALQKWPVRPFEELNVDENILNYFHENSFKGPEIEKAILTNILFSPITFVAGKHKEKWECEFKEKFGMPLHIGLWQNRGHTRLYLNDPETGVEFGYIDINGWTSHFADQESIQYHEFLKQLIRDEHGGLLPDSTTLSTMYHKPVARNTLSGILEYLDNPHYKGFLIGFKNHYTEDIHKNELLLFIRNHLIANFSENQHEKIYEAATSKNSSFEDYYDEIPHAKEDFPESPQFEAFKALWHARRTKSDTDKAIYRLICLGIVDDYNVDFRDDTYLLDIRQKTPGQYMEALYDYIRRYYSEDRVRRMLEQFQSVSLPSSGLPIVANSIELKQGKTLNDLFTEMVDFVVDFAYREIAAKRRAAIGDIFRAYDDYLNNEQSTVGSGNFALKSYLYLYFNSKYAREGYEAKLDDADAAMAYSLRDETQGGTVLSFDRMLAYVRLMEKDRSGSETDNLKHLRGASTRLLRSDPDNASLLLLKAFSMFALSAQFESQFTEACSDCEKGFIEYLKTEKEESIEKHLAAYEEAVKDYLTAGNKKKVTAFLDELRRTLLLRFYNDWLKNFNQHFLIDFPQPTA